MPMNGSLKNSSRVWRRVCASAIKGVLPSSQVPEHGRHAEAQFVENPRQKGHDAAKPMACPRTVGAVFRHPSQRKIL